jgi:hypothetical protein
MYQDKSECVLQLLLLNRGAFEKGGSLVKFLDAADGMMPTRVRVCRVPEMQKHDEKLEKLFLV